MLFILVKVKTETRSFKVSNPEVSKTWFETQSVEILFLKCCLSVKGLYPCIRILHIPSCRLCHGIQCLLRTCNNILTILCLNKTACTPF